MPAYPAANAQTYVLFAISGLKKEGLSGEIHAPTAWPVSAAVPKRLSSMENIVRGCPAILAPAAFDKELREAFFLKRFLFLYPLNSISLSPGF